MNAHLQDSRFIQNRWFLIYLKLVESRQKNPTQSDNYENHHIRPKSMGGIDVDDNMVRLTRREHYIAHLLLTKCTKGRAKFSMCKALHRMQTDKRISGSRAYDRHRAIAIEGMRGFYNEEAIRKTSEARRGNPLKDSHKQNISNGLKGYKATDEHRARNAAARIGRKDSEEVRRIKSEMQQGKKRGPQIKYTCDVCGKIGSGTAISRRHFSSCALLSCEPVEA